MDDDLGGTVLAPCEEVTIDAGKTEADFSVTGNTPGKATVTARLATATSNLTPDQVRDMAKVAYPTIVKQLTGSELEANTRIDYALPAEHARRAVKTRSEAR